MSKAENVRLHSDLSEMSDNLNKTTEESHSRHKSLLESHQAIDRLKRELDNMTNKKERMFRMINEVTAQREEFEGEIESLKSELKEEKGNYTSAENENKKL